ncbi:ATP-binding protein [Rhodococcus qingshengii]|uniref:ATP-binding protein n=1 Tax=Rhodococcus qingshengii TaxID=334542 RepID=UPI001C5D28E0|nr:AAA family ATPase [Rhodococcus qingshengii]MBW4818826.1 hypothetical protein [Rhodococcus qingshengii]
MTTYMPQRLSSFVGRRRERTELRRLLSKSRLVTLTGIGGVGKTALALRTAEDVRRAFQGGVQVIELGELNDPSHLVGYLAHNFDLPAKESEHGVDDLVTHLGSRPTLLILDNCEHLIDAVARLTVTLIQSCAELRIISTSREPLRIDGEAVYLVPPLSIPDSSREVSAGELALCDAVTLFAERARTALPGFEVDTANVSTVAAICRHVDGLPLLIELAVARLRSMSLNQILERLDDRYKLLTLGSRGAPARQQTLRMCTNWSYELCTVPERALWSCLSVFSGGFELDAIEYICGGDPLSTNFMDNVASLVDKSILIREETGSTVRFRILDTLRDYNFAREDADVDTALRHQRRHRDWCKRLVSVARSQWIGPDQQS